MKNKLFLFILSFFLILLINNSLYSVEPDEILLNKKHEERARIISKNIRCMVCQNQSIDESSSPLAKDLRVLIRNKIVDGKKDREIYQFLTDRYGDFILLKPPVKFNTLLLWFLPVFFFLLGIYIVFFHNNKFKKLK